MATGTDRDLDEERDVDLPAGLELPDLETLLGSEAGAAGAGGMRRLRVGEDERAADRDGQPSRDGERTPEREARRPADGRERGRGDFGAAAREERTKRKRLADKLRIIESEHQALLSTRSSGVASSRIRQTTPQPLAVLAAKVAGQPLADRLASLKDFGDKAETMGDVAVKVFEELRADLLTLDEDLVNRVDFRAAKVSEHTFRKLTPDYNDKLTAADVFTKLKIDPTTKQFVDPVVARRVFGAENPAEEAYEIAEAILDDQQRLGTDGRLLTERDRDRARVGDHSDDRGRGDRERADDRGRGRRDAREPAEPTEEFEDDRGRESRAPHQARQRDERGPDRDRDDRGAGDGDRGEAVNFDDLPDSRPRFRGIRRLADAGSSGRARITREYLDVLMERDPTKYEQIAPVGSALERWHMQEERG